MSLSMALNKTNKDKALQTYEQAVPLDPLLFYIRDYELYYTALSAPRYNEYAIFIDYHEWELSATCLLYTSDAADE